MKSFYIPAMVMSLTMSYGSTHVMAQVVPAGATEKAGLNKAGAIDKKTSGASIRASQMIGMNVYNTDGKSLGKINDLVIDSSRGKVRYAAVSYGGFLGLGDKLFAVPWAAFQTHAGTKANDHRLILNLNEKQLKGASGFDQEHWPDFGDPAMTDKLDEYYGFPMNDHHDRGDVDVNVSRSGIKVDVDRKRD